MSPRVVSSLAALLPLPLALLEAADQSAKPATTKPNITLMHADNDVFELMNHLTTKLPREKIDRSGSDAATKES